MPYAQAMDNSALARAIDACGSQAELARRIGAHTQQIHEWRKGERPIAHHWCPAIEAATGGAVQCNELRDDVEWERDDDNRVTGYRVLVDAETAKRAKNQKAA
jgi:DNA-binding transcriptional regulator YdaS (Cro superfamily)